MKCKFYFALIWVLIILFSLASVSASENLTSNASPEDAMTIDMVDSQILLDEDLNSQPYKSQNALSNENEDNVDLSVWIDVENAYHDNEYNRAGFDVPWTITVNATGGTAHNAKIYGTFSDNLKYMIHNASMGTFDPNTGIWNIGNLSDTTATLTILTKLKEDGKYVITATATTDSNDIDTSNNYLMLYIRTGSSKITSNITQTSDDQQGAGHNIHQGSAGNSGFVIIEEEYDDPADDSHEEKTPTKRRPGRSENHDSSSGSDTGGKSQSRVQGKIDSNNDKINPVIKKTFDPIVQTTKSITNSISNSIRNLFNPTSILNDDGSNSNVSKETIKAIRANDYTTIPLIIFGLFLVILLPIAAYDKIKS